MDGISGYFSDSSETKSGGNSPAKGTLNEEILKKIRAKNMTTVNEAKKPLEQFNIPLTKQEPEMETGENNLSIALDQPVQSEDNMTSDAVRSQKSHSRSKSRSRSHSRSRSASHSKRHRSRSDSPRRKRRSRSRSPKNKKSRSRSRSPTPKQRKSSRSETPKGKKRSRSRSPRRSRSRSVKRRHRSRSRSRSPRRRHRSRSRTPSRRRRRSGSRSRRRRSRSKSRDRRRRQSRSYSQERRGSRRRKHDRSRSRSGSKPRSKSRSPSGERSPSPERGGSNDEQLNRLECKLDDLVGQVTRLESVQTGMLQALTNLNRLIDIKNRHPSTLAFSAKGVARPRSQTVVTSTSPRVVFPTTRVVYTSPEMPSAKKLKQDEPVIGRVFQDEMVEVGSTGSKPPVIIKRELLQKALATSSDAKVYACKLVKHLFTPEELARSSFEGESKIQGGARTARLDRWRIAAILSQVESDYPGCMSGKGLSVIKTSVNSTCRGMRAFFPQQDSSVSLSSPRAADVSSSRPPQKSDSHSRSPSPARSVSRSPKRSGSKEKSKSRKTRSRSKSSGSERSASASPERPDKSKKERGSRSRSRSPEVKAKSKSRQSRSRSASPEKKQAKSRRKSRSRSRTPRRSSKRRSRSKTPKRRRRHSFRSRSRTPPRRGKSSRSRRRSRSKSPPRRKSRSRSRKRSRSPRRSRSRSKKRSRTPKRRKRSRSRSPRKRRPKSRSRSPRRRQSKSKSPKRRHRTRTRSRSRSISPLIRVRDPAMHAQEALARRLERAKKLMEMKGKREKEEKEKKIKDEKESNVDKESAEKATTSLAPPPLMSLTPMAIDPLIQAAAAAAAMQAKVLAETGISVPKYYNPLTVNPVQIAEQTRKRKLLWSGKKEEMLEKPSSNQWENTAFGDDATKAKFRRLMGIKEGEEADESEDAVRQQEVQARLFKQLDQEYQIARVKTHTQRSFGLGFGTMAAAPPPTVATPTAGAVQPTTSGT